MCTLMAPQDLLPIYSQSPALPQITTLTSSCKLRSNKFVINNKAGFVIKKAKVQHGVRSVKLSRAGKRPTKECRLFPASLKSYAPSPSASPLAYVCPCECHQRKGSSFTFRCMLGKYLTVTSLSQDPLPGV